MHTSLQDDRIQEQIQDLVVKLVIEKEKYS